VTWTNQDFAPHTATADDGSFDTGRLDQGETGSVTFDQPGTYTYTCTFHPNMKGTVVVT
jgi:plastocyanin